MAKLSDEQRAQYLNDAAKANEKYNASSGQQPEKVPDGAHRYRILPHWHTKSPATPDAYRRYARHWIKSPNRTTQDGGRASNILATTLCQRNTDMKPCPVCDAYWNVKKSPGLSKDVERLLGEMNASTKFLVNALHRNSAEPDKVIVLELPFKVGTAIFGDPKAQTSGLFGQAVNLIGAYPMDLEDGVDVIIRKTGSGFNTTYAVEFPNPIQSAPVNPSVLDQLVDLDAYIEAWRHTADDELKAVNTINGLLQASQPNQAILMGGGFVQAPAAQPVYQAMPQNVPVNPYQPAPAAPAQPQPNVVQVAGGAVNLSEDVFATPPIPAQQFSTDVPDGDIEALLGTLDQQAAA
jgi:hypothetical protein